MTRELWIRDAKRCCDGGAGKGAGRGERTGAGRGERTGAHRRGLWVAAPHPVRPLSHTHPPRGALLGLATVRRLAAAPPAPQQRILRLSLRLRRRPRPSVSVARLARAPGRSSRARAASARDRGKGWETASNPSAVRKAHALRQSITTHSQGPWGRRRHCARAKPLPPPSGVLDAFAAAGWKSQCARALSPKRSPSTSRSGLQPPLSARLFWMLHPFP